MKYSASLTTPPFAPYFFTVGIEASEQVIITVESEEKIACYALKERNHSAFLNFFDDLSFDFGLRLPRNKQASPQPNLNIPYREVLTKNLVPEMLYGYGDPAILKVDKPGQTLYYLISTSNDAPNSFPIIKSKDLEEWKFAGFVFPEGKKPGWAADGEIISDFWAPELHQFENEFRLYFVARDKETRELCIGLATARSPEGEYIAEEKPLLKGNVIDPHVYIENTETAYLYWKEDNNDIWPGALLELLYEHPELIPALFTELADQKTAVFTLTLFPWLQTLQPMERFQISQLFIEAITGQFRRFYQQLETLSQNEFRQHRVRIENVLHFMTTRMFAQQLSPAGKELSGEKVKILENDLDWEAHLVEGMWLTKQQDKYFLFYAGNDFSTPGYGIGLAVANSPVGPFIKEPQPFLQSSEKWWAPGHPSVTEDEEGNPVMFLHAFVPYKAGYKGFRALLALPLRFEAEKVKIDPGLLL